MQFNKLVRDKIPEIIRSRGETPFVHIADSKEYEKALEEKLREEVTEFLEKPSVEEAADILEVLRATCAFKDIDITALEKARQKKYDERGGFEKRIILERTE
ncbi:nucleoside triphosphate pyrophosphohydrolase [Candidatus Microgenomates bacterium]|nr:nucleoside triphosphate pyrophosphohydrolase [Candidatus Microgenomates bacterium]